MVFGLVHLGFGGQNCVGANQYASLMSGLGGAVGARGLWEALGGALTQREKVLIFRDIYVHTLNHLSSPPYQR